MARADSSPHAKSQASCCAGSSGGTADTSALSAYGSHDPRGGVQLHGTYARLGSSSPANFSMLVSGDRRVGERSSDQNWRLQWVNRLLLALRHSQLEERIFKFDHPTAAKMFRKGAASLRHQGTTLYHARHSGASIDRAGQHRTLSEVQKREQWVRQEQPSGGRFSGTASPDKMQAGTARATCRGATSWQALKSGFHRRARGHYILEVFGRDGDVCAATSRLGYRGHVLDERDGKRYDLTQPRPLARIRPPANASVQT